MGNEHGGRRIKICVYEYAYPHSESAKRSGKGQEFPICSTGYKRPANAFEDLVEKLLDMNMTNDMVVYHSVVRYRLNRIGKNLAKPPTQKEVKSITSSMMSEPVKNGVQAKA